MTKTSIFRPFKPTLAEYEAIVHVYNQANPYDPGSATSWQHWDKHRDPARLFTRYVAEKQGRIGGYGYSVRTDPAANKYRFAIHFLSHWKTAEFIDKFYSYIMDLCLAHAPSALLSQAREDETQKIAWLRNHGFHPVMRYPCSTLTVGDFDPAAYGALRAKIADQGIEIISLAELAKREPDWQRKVYDLEMLLSQDVPRPTTFVPTPFEQYVQREFEGPDFMPELCLIAVDGDTYVGMTSLYKSGDGFATLETDLTGVQRDYRRRGLATALKAQAIELAQLLGASQIVTFNEENNPMFQLNLRLGFRAQPADVDWQRSYS